MEAEPERNPPQTLAERIHWLGFSFSRRDQPMIAALTLFCFAGMAACYWHRSNQLNGLIDIDRLPKRVATFQVDINQAAWPEIANLPGIGPRLAKAIVEHRQTYGPFPTVAAIKDVSGIGDAKYQKILPHLWIGDEPGPPEPLPTSNR